MAGQISPLAGKKPDPAMLVDVARLVTAYFTGKPDPSVPSQRVAFGTSGHRGSAFDNAFNEDHILAISQAICRHRAQNGVDGPLYIGIDTHALSQPALASALEVFAANDVEVMIDAGDGYTPTPVVSHAILTYNKNRKSGLADGIVITPSHNPPEDGGFKYNPPSGGPADTGVTKWIENAANALIEKKLEGVRRMPYERARKSPPIHRHDYIGAYVPDLANVVDMAAIRASGVKIGIDPLGGASVHFWQPIIETYGLDATIVNDTIDPTFRFMPLDWDGRIRMDCSSPYAMAGLIAMRDKFDVAFANDTDADRHGIVTRSKGLMNPNHYLAAAISYLFEQPARLGQRLRRGQDHRQQRHHRPRRREARPQAGRDAGGPQMVRRRASRRLSRLRRRGERRRHLPPARRIGLDDGQGWADSRSAGRGDHRQDQAGSEPDLSMR